MKVKDNAYLQPNQDHYFLAVQFPFPVIGKKIKIITQNNPILYHHL